MSSFVTRYYSVVHFLYSTLEFITWSSTLSSVRCVVNVATRAQPPNMYLLNLSSFPVEQAKVDMEVMKQAVGTALLTPR